MSLPFIQILKSAMSLESSVVGALHRPVRPRREYQEWVALGKPGVRCGKSHGMRPTVRRRLIVAALFVVSCGIATPLAAFGVFLPVLAEAFGWSRGAVSTALSINLVVGGLAGFGIGALADRYGPRVMLILTVALAGMAFALVSKVHALWQIYLFVGILGGIGTSSFYLLSTTTIA